MPMRLVITPDIEFQVRIYAARLWNRDMVPLLREFGSTAPGLLQSQFERLIVDVQVYILNLMSEQYARAAQFQ